MGTILACAGARVGGLAIPAFALGAEEIVCLHLPRHVRTSRLVATLTGARRRRGIRVSGLVVAATSPGDPVAGRRGLLRLVTRRARVVDWLAETAGVDRAVSLALAASLAAELGPRLDPDAPADALPAGLALRLGLEAVWARPDRPDAVVFEARGLDRGSVDAIHAAVAGRLSECSALHVSPPGVDGQRRACPPGARCVLLDRAAAPRPPSGRLGRAGATASSRLPRAPGDR